MTNGQPLTLDVSLSVLDDLGTNLYSSIPAVLSEAVANAWDADADEVRIDIDRDARRITIHDSGIGMTRAEVQERYLTIGYRRREAGESRTPRGRSVMGRKGIGKLSLFAIADTVEVVTKSRQGSAVGFTLHAPTIRERARAKESYSPHEFEPTGELESGTKITLSNLRLSPNALTQTALRKRIAKRFAIIGERLDFRALVDGEAVTLEDRDDLPHLQYLWVIGQPVPDPRPLAGKAVEVSSLPERVTAAGVQDEVLAVRGWLGTFPDQRSVNQDGDDNQVAVLARGKIAHENLLSNVKASGYYARYLIGRIEADFLDDDGKPDIATSNRQAVKETDERFEQVVGWFKKSLVTVAEDWNRWREDRSLQDAMDEFPAIREWHNGLSGDAKSFAKQLFGKIGRLNKADDETKRELYRNAIMAFERLQLREELNRIDELPDTPDLGVLTALFRGIDEIEEVEYHRIAEGRLSVVRKFQDLVDNDARERVLQDYLFDHLWLLDPAWERAAKSEYIEKTVLKAFEKVTAKLSKEEKDARIDIGYRTHAGKHVIVELKRASARPRVDQLLGQLSKYRDALEKVLTANATSADGAPEIEIVAVLGMDPSGNPVSRERKVDALRAINARWVTYGSLFVGTEEAYREYLEAHARASRLNELLLQIGPPGD